MLSKMVLSASCNFAIVLEQIPGVGPVLHSRFFANHPGNASNLPLCDLSPDISLDADVLGTITHTYTWEECSWMEFLPEKRHWS